MCRANSSDLANLLPQLVQLQKNGFSPKEKENKIIKQSGKGS